jgi:hypothetical protein
MKATLFAFLLLFSMDQGFPAAGEEPAILSVTREGYGGGAHYRLMAQPLREAGFQIDTCDQSEIPAKLATGRYNVLVWSPLWDLTYGPHEEEFKRQFPEIQEALAGFIARGGGILVMGPADQTGLTASRALTEPWGGRLLHESIHDRAGHKTYFVPWAYTTQVSGPAAPGVRGIWYPSGGDPGSSGKWWWPVEVDANWQVVLRGEPTTTARFERWTTDTDQARRREPVSGGVPLAAVRPLGQGRVALVGLPQTYSFAAPHSWPGADVVLYAGLDGQPSDGRRFLFNLLRWLAEPSQQAGLGGATTPDSLLQPYRYRQAQPPPPVRWEAPLARQRRFYRGLAGARTVLSTGQSTVEEYARAAKEAGLDFLIFLEDHRAMTPEKNEQLRQECRQVSDGTFQAIPGFTIEDEFGNFWFVLGEKATYPERSYLSPDGKVLAGHWQAEPRVNRTLGSVMNHITGGQWQYQVAVGSWNHRRASMPPWDFRNHSAVAVVTQDENGEILDDIAAEYRLIQNNGNQLSPYAITLMSRASQVAEHVRNGFLTYVQLDHLEDARKVLGSVRGGEDPDQFITNGPMIVEWRSSNRFYPQAIGDLFRPDLYRMQIRLRVRGEGLQEVCLYEGDQLFRRYLPGGAGQFQQTLEIFNIPQHRLILTATDRRGRWALSKDLTTRFLDFQEFICGDRNNQIFNQYTARPDGSVFYGASPTGNGVTPDKGPAVWLIIPCYPYAYDERTPTCPWDGGSIPPGYALHLRPQVNVEGEPELPLHNTPRRVLHSPDAMVGEAVIDGAFEERFRPYMAMVWESLFPVVPTRFLTGKMRLTYWRTKPEGYTTTLFEETLRFHKPVTLAGEFPLILGTLSSGVDNCNVEIRDAAGRIYRGRSKETAPFTGELGESGYICFFNRDADSETLGQTSESFKQNCSTMFFSLTKGLRFRFEGGSMILFLKPETTSLQANTEFSVSLLGVGTPIDCLEDAPARVTQALGTDTGRPAYTLSLSRGRVLSKRHVLMLDGQGKGVAGEISQADLPGYLPVMVAGLQDRWTAVHLDRITGHWRPLGVANGIAYAVLDPAASPQQFFLGHPVVCDRPELTLQLTQTGARKWTLEVHNPTPRAIPTVVSSEPEFTPCQFRPFHVVVGAGRSIIRTLPGPASPSA